MADATAATATTAARLGFCVCRRRRGRNLICSSFICDSLVARGSFGGQRDRLLLVSEGVQCLGRERAAHCKRKERVKVKEEDGEMGSINGPSRNCGKSYSDVLAESNCAAALIIIHHIKRYRNSNFTVLL
jgi:hypothetical protein